VFSQFEVQRGLPIQMLVKYFKQTGDSAAQCRYPRHGAASPAEPAAGFLPLGKFDIIFCRNVLIYFDQNTKASIFERLSRQLEADGALALGAAESVVGITDAFKPYPDRRGMYCRTRRGPRRARPLRRRCRSSW